MRRFALLLAFVPSLAVTPAAAADPRTCIAAAEDAQLARYHGKLRAARDGFVQCARTDCPAAIHTDCARWLAEVDASLPSVVLGAAWGDGGDVVDATITVDGASAPDAANGRALALDPGEHVVVFSHAGAASVTTTVVVHEGERNRAIRATLVRETPRAPEVASTTTTTRPVPLASWLLAGGAIVGVGTGVGLYMSGRSGLDDLRGSCGHRCDPDDVDGQRAKLLVGDVVVAASVLALGAATWLFLRRPAIRTGQAGVTFRF